MTLRELIARLEAMPPTAVPEVGIGRLSPGTGYCELSFYPCSGVTFGEMAGRIGRLREWNVFGHNVIEAPTSCYVVFHESLLDRLPAAIFPRDTIVDRNEGGVGWFPITNAMLDAMAASAK